MIWFLMFQSKLNLWWWSTEYTIHNSHRVNSGKSREEVSSCMSVVAPQRFPITFEQERNCEIEEEAKSNLHNFLSVFLIFLIASFAFEEINGELCRIFVCWFRVPTEEEKPVAAEWWKNSTFIRSFEFRHPPFSSALQTRFVHSSQQQSTFNNEIIRWVNMKILFHVWLEWSIFLCVVCFCFQIIIVHVWNVLWISIMCSNFEWNLFEFDSKGSFSRSLFSFE